MTGRALSVVHVSASDSAGGSARSAYRIHRGLLGLGVRSRMLVNQRARQEAEIAPVWRWRGLRAAEAASGAVFRRLSLPDVAYPSSYALAWHPWVQDADAVQLYNLHGGYFSYPALAGLGRRKPLIWRLSDMWPLTGHCAFAEGCERWRTGCGACPDLSLYPALRRDTTAWHWRAKQRTYAGVRTVVTPTRWLRSLAQASPLLRHARVEHIPNGVDTVVFRPQQQAGARRRLGLPQDGRLIAFLNLSPRGTRKGNAILPDIVQRLAALEPSGWGLVIAGDDGTQLAGRLRVPVHAVGRVDGSEAIAAFYAAADVLAHPATADNLPNAILESLACGTPVVTFDVGGCTEAVRHGETGCAVLPGDAAAFAEALRRLLTDAALRHRLGYQGRELIEREFALEREARVFHALLQSVAGGAARADVTDTVGADA